MLTTTLLVTTLLAAQAPQALPTTGGLGDPAVLDALVRRGDEAHAALDPLGALALFTRVLAEDAGRYDALWRAAREAVNLDMLASDSDERTRRADEAVDFARRALAARPAGAEGAVWLAIALGRRALEHGPKTRARMAVDVREAALAALALDPDAAGAHHVLGEWHAEIRRLSRLERWAARKLLGADELGEASWELAIEHLERAAALAPEGLIHHLDLARAYLDVGRRDDARRALQEVLDRPVLEPVDPLHKQAARRLLERL